MRLYVDFESRSRVDLRKTGAYRYAEDPSTEILCLAVAADDDPPFLWTPSDDCGHLPDERLSAMLRDAGTIHAHNAGFERAIWFHKMPRQFPLPPVELWRDSAAQAAACCLPRDLGGACDALGLANQKDVEGRTLMLKLCKPRKDGTWDGTPEEFHKLYRYCIQDVVAERELAKALPPLSLQEQLVWILDQEINDRGIPVDAAFLRGILSTLKEIDKDRLAKIRKLTSGLVESPRQVAVLGTWLRGQGAYLKDMTARTVKDYLASGKATPEVAAVLRMRQELAKSSTAKYSAALACIGKESRIRGALLYHGANTGRWAGRLVQPQNFPRCKLSPEELDGRVFDFFAGLDPDPMGTASLALRSCVSSPKGLTWGDKDQIEARTLAWLAGDLDILDDFRAGRDVYVSAASEIYSVPKEKIGKESDERQVGKVAVLALGYGGGIGAFVSMATGVYNVDLSKMVAPVTARATPDQIAKAQKAVVRYKKMAEEPIPDDQALACDLVKQYWRASRPETVKFWYALADTVAHVIRNPENVCRLGALRIGMLSEWLIIRLPSGRRLYYFQPCVNADNDISCMRNQSARKKSSSGWMRVELHGGIFAENITQAVSRDILVEDMLAMQAEKIPIVLTVHDEIVVEGDCREAVQRIMSRPVSWAVGLPIAAKVGHGRRYGK